MAHQDDVEEIMKALDLIAERIPEYGFATAATMRALVRYSGVPDACIRATVETVTHSPRLSQAGIVNTAEALDTIDFARVYELVAAKLENMARGVRCGIARRRARTGHEVLTALAMAKRLLNAEPELKRHLRIIRKHLAKKQRRFPAKKKA